MASKRSDLYLKCDSVSATTEPATGVTMGGRPTDRPGGPIDAADHPVSPG